MTKKHKNEIFEQFLSVLNEAVKADSEAILALLKSRIECNEELAAHPTIQVATVTNKRYRVGALGLTNGICEKITGRRIAASMSADDKLLGFVEYKP